MKKLLLSTVAFASLTAGAMAADLPSRRVAPAPYVAVPVFTWTGFYVGVNAGYGFGTGGNNNNGSVFLPPGSIVGAPAVSGTLTNGTGNGSRDGFVGGGQIGYNYQIGNIVVGVEADAQYADLGRRNNQFGTFTFASGGVGTFPAAFPGTIQSGVDWFGTVRGRVGYAWDRLLVFGTGGFAYGQGPQNCFGGFRAALVAAGAGASGCGNNDTRTGWAAGGGVEYAFTPNMTGKIEGLYVNLNAPQNTVGLINGFPVRLTNSRRLDNEFVVVRAGLNWKFGTW